MENMNDKIDPGSLIISTLEKAWRDIQVRNSEVPDVIFITGTGAVKDGVKWGHFHAEQWVTEAGRVHELFVSGEALMREPEETMTTLLHEASHAISYSKGVKGTSRKGKYHNKKFVKQSEELGLVWPEGQPACKVRGFSAVVMKPEAVELYASTIEAIREGRAAWRELGLAPAAEATPKSTNTKPKAECACPGRYIWTARKTLEEAPVICGECEERFEILAA